jgi:hypothetical protein
MNEPYIEVYLCVGSQLRVMKAFIYKKWAEEFVEQWNKDPDNKDDKTWVETYHALQCPAKYYGRDNL